MIAYSHAALRRARESAGLSRELLAVRAGCTESAIRKYEGGERVPSAARLGHLATAIGCDIGSLFCVEESRVA